MGKGAQQKTKEVSLNAMDRHEREALEENRELILRDLDCSPILIAFQQDGLLSTDECERIRLETTTQDKRQALLDIIVTKGPDVFDLFTRTLWKNPGQRHICDSLKLARDRIRKEEQGYTPQAIEYVKRHLENTYEEKPNQIIEANQIILTTREKFPVNIRRPECRLRMVKYAVKECFQNAQYFEGNQSEVGGIFTGLGEKTQEAEPSGAVKNKDLKTMTPIEVKKWLKDIDIGTKNLGSIIMKEKIRGSVLLGMSEDDMKTIFKDELPYGDMKTLISELAMIQQSSRKHEILRRFDADGKNVTYKKGSIVKIENSPPEDLLYPIHHFVDLDVSNAMDRFIQETMEFACACLNNRRNGTIYFGISPSHSMALQESTVLGTLTQPGVNYALIIKKAIKESFLKEQYEIFGFCIRDPHIIPVENPDNTELYVLEIDIVPSAIICGNRAFFYTAREKHCLLTYTSSKVQVSSHEDIMPKKEDLFRQRSKQERYATSQRERSNLKSKLLNLLCKSDDGYWGDTSHVLVVNRLDSPTTLDKLKANFGFLAQIPWETVIDFDSSAVLRVFMDEELGYAMKVISSCNDFDPRSKENVENSERLNNMLYDIKQRTHTPWIFADGYDPLAISKSQSVVQWKKSTIRGFNELIKFLDGDASPSSTLIVFMLLSDDWYKMAAGAEELIKIFPENWMVIGHSRSTVDPWIDHLISRDALTLEDGEMRAVIGMPWEHVNAAIEAIQDPTSSGRAKLSTSTGVLCDISDQLRNDLTDISILSANECDIERDGIDVLNKQQEEMFYKGQEATWWNFYFQDHVCKRRQYSKLHSQVKAALENVSVSQHHVDKVSFFHQPGSGGTTLGMQILWDLREEFRCAVVDRVTNSTAKQIRQLLFYKEPNSPNPVLLFLDNQEDENHLWFKLGEECKNASYELHATESERIRCVMLCCNRKTDMPDRCTAGEQSVFLKHELARDELSWFKKKAEQIESIYEQGGIDPKLLISFNIMKENFNPKFIQKNVSCLIDDITDCKELNLLKYVSLLNTYDSNFQAIPTAVFTKLMQPASRKMSILSQTPWEIKLSSTFHILINEKKKTGRGKLPSLRITNPLLSKHVVQCICMKKELRLSDISCELLSSRDLFNTGGDRAKEAFKSIVCGVLRHRDRDVEGKLATMWAPLIQAIADDESRSRALEVLHAGYQATDDPFVAQQIARMYIALQNWDKATEYAEITTKRIPNNSFFWDTRGRICKEQLVEYQKQFKSSKHSEREAKRVTSLTLSGMYFFQKEREICQNRDDMDTQKEVALIGELHCASLFLECCSKLPGLTRKALHGILLKHAEVPSQLAFLETMQHPELPDEPAVHHVREILQKIRRAKKEIDDDEMQLQKDLPSDTTEKNAQNAQLENVSKKLAEFFDRATSNITSGEDASRLRRMKIFSLGGGSFKSMLDLKRSHQGIENLQMIQKFSLENIKDTNTGNADDYQTLLCSIFVLGNIQENTIDNFDQLIEWSRILYEMRDIRDIRSIVSLEPYLFYVMLHWPIKDNFSESMLKPRELQKVLHTWKDAFYYKHPKPKETHKSIKGDPREREKIVFYIANGNDFESIVSHSEMQKKAEGRVGQAFWSTPEIRSKLKRFDGILCNDGKEIRLAYRYDSTHTDGVTIQTACYTGQRSWWYKKVYFVIGFCWSGPKAYDVCRENPVPASEALAPNLEKWEKVPSRKQKKKSK